MWATGPAGCGALGAAQEVHPPMGRGRGWDATRNDMSRPWLHAALRPSEAARNSLSAASLSQTP